ncbi:MAG: hypothetical protein ACTSPG_05400 [Candidatus Hodarchaeales archaeon]
MEKRVKSNDSFEKYPYRIICVSASLTALNYLLGTLVLYVLDTIIGFLFLFFCIFTILVSMRTRCSCCAYHGRWCNIGLGKLSGLVFKKGDPVEFRNPKNVILTVILGFTTIFLPVFVGIILIILDFSLFTVSLLAVYVLIGFFPNLLLREKLCVRCEQGVLGCPEYERMIKRKNPL